MREGFILMPDNGASIVINIAYSAPTKYGVYRANVFRFDVSKIVAIKAKEMINSPQNAPALPYTPGAVTA